MKRKEKRIKISPRSDTKVCNKISNESKRQRKKQPRIRSLHLVRRLVNIEVYHWHLSLITCSACKLPIINVSKPKIATEFTHTRSGLFFVHSVVAARICYLIEIEQMGLADSTSPKLLRDQSLVRT